ncbi:MAG: ATP--guanido phosphotransferase [Clostridiales bacterium]|nr:ATP--guanido phosphotransferase [Clostridiales bacterium]
MAKQSELYKSVVVSTRIRLARNFADYPFPNRLKNVSAAREIVKLVAAGLSHTEMLDLYYMNAISDEKAEFLKERNLISQDLINHRPISAALVSRDESISVMINEEDHIREQYFMRGFDLRAVYERVVGIDDIISECIPFAYDESLGYLTACPTNLGTGLRASAMLFLPALTRRNLMRRITPELTRKGLVVRGAFGEGSGTEGELYQISNEVTLGISEDEILDVVEQMVKTIVEFEQRERARMLAEEEIALTDRILRAYGILTSCMRIDLKEFMLRMSDVKLGVALGILGGDYASLDDLIVDMRPANINRLNGAPLAAAEQDIYRAEYVGKALRGMDLLTTKERNALQLRSEHYTGGN